MSTVDRTATRIRGFAASELDFQLMRQLGAATAGGGTPGEIMAARGAIPGDDITAWPAAFARLADGLVAQADAALGRGHRVTAREALLRASSYYRSCEYFTDPFAAEARRYGMASEDCFRRALPLLPGHAQPVAIPFDGLTLPGYLLQPVGVERANRTLICLTGFDGTAEELYFQTAADGLARGFTVLLAQGPGQMGTLRHHPELVFRPDYEAPVAAMVDFAETRPEIDPGRLALYGISFGGYFVTRAAVHEPRLAALIANSPIVDLHAYMGAFVAGADVPEEAQDQDVTLEEVDEIPDAFMPPAVKLGFKSACRRFGVSSMSGWMTALTAYRVGDLSRIACPCLAMAGAGEGEATLAQTQSFAEGVSGPVTTRLFIAAEGADMHCQLGNLPLSNAVLYDWLDEAMPAG